MLKSPISFSKRAVVVDCDPNLTMKREIDLTRFYLRSAGAVIDGILIDKWKFNYPRHNWIQWHNKHHSDNPWTHDSPWYITNAVLCRTTDVTRLKDSPPEGVPRAKCKRWLAIQWAAVQPKLIVCFGRTALGVLMKSEKRALTIPANTMVETKFGPVLFQNHPAFFMREKNKETKAFGFAKVASTLERALEYVGLPTG